MEVRWHSDMIIKYDRKEVRWHSDNQIFLTREIAKNMSLIAKKIESPGRPHRWDLIPKG